MRRLGQRLDVQAPASPRDRGGQVAGVLRPGGQRAEHAGQLGGVLVARAQRPVAVEAVEQLAAARRPRRPRGLRRRGSRRNSHTSTRTESDSPTRWPVTTSASRPAGPSARRSSYSALRSVLRALSSGTSGRSRPASAERGCGPGDSASRASSSRARASAGSSTGRPSTSGGEATEDAHFEH